MSRIRGKDTEPEWTVRRALHRMGYRYRLHVASLPGRPDIVLPRHRVVFEIRGCFWHGHTCRKGALPHSNVRFWRTKIDANRERDRRNARLLAHAGWRVYVLWECRIDMASSEKLSRLLQTRLDPSAT